MLAIAPSAHIRMAFIVFINVFNILRMERFKYMVRYILPDENMEIAITKISSKGQIVIPSELREGMKEGDKLVIIKDNHQLILKKASDFDKILKEDLEFAKRTEEAYNKYEKGEFKEMEFDDFINEMKKW